jgi:hypothetical protein
MLVLKTHVPQPLVGVMVGVMAANREETDLDPESDCGFIARTETAAWKIEKHRSLMHYETMAQCHTWRELELRIYCAGVPLSTGMRHCSGITESGKGTERLASFGIGNS